MATWNDITDIFLMKFLYIWSCDDGCKGEELDQVSPNFLRM
jgi:hypothetical protein